MNISGILEGLKKAADAAETMLPAAEALGLPDIVGKISGVVSSAVDVAINIKERIDEGTVVVANENKAEIDAIIQRLQTANDALAKAVAAS